MELKGPECIEVIIHLTTLSACQSTNVWIKPKLGQPTSPSSGTKKLATEFFLPSLMDKIYGQTHLLGMVMVGTLPLAVAAGGSCTKPSSEKGTSRCQCEVTLAHQRCIPWLWWFWVLGMWAELSCDVS